MRTTHTYLALIACMLTLAASTTWAQISTVHVTGVFDGGLDFTSGEASLDTAFGPLLGEAFTVDFTYDPSLVDNSGGLLFASYELPIAPGVVFDLTSGAATVSVVNETSFRFDGSSPSAKVFAGDNPAEFSVSGLTLPGDLNEMGLSLDFDLPASAVNFTAASHPAVLPLSPPYTAADLSSPDTNVSFLLTLTGGGGALLLGEITSVSVTPGFPTVIDNPTPPVDGAGGYNISNAVAAADFQVVESPHSLAQTLRVYLTDNVSASNGQLDDFSGTLSWAIYDNDGGEPGTLIDTWVDASPTLTDMGIDSSTGSDIFSVDLSFGGDEVALDPGTYWLALHEGAWGSAFDGSPVFWLTEEDALLGLPDRFAEDEVNVTPWGGIDNPTDSFIFEFIGETTLIPEPSSLALLGLGGLALARRRNGTRSRADA